MKTDYPFPSKSPCASVFVNRLHVPQNTRFSSVNIPLNVNMPFRSPNSIEYNNLVQQIKMNDRMSLITYISSMHSTNINLLVASLPHHHYPPEDLQYIYPSARSRKDRPLSTHNHVIVINLSPLCFQPPYYAYLIRLFTLLG